MKKRVFFCFLLGVIILTFGACSGSENAPHASDSLDGSHVQSESAPDAPEGNAPAPELTADERKAMQIREEIKAKMTENTAEYKVLECGAVDNPVLADGEKAIWVQSLDWKPYGTTTDEAKSRVRAVYFYYPMHEDPSQYTDAQLKSMGATRVFAYMGTPKGATATNQTQGIVCVHGGSGHAYANYVLEAVRHGYAAIAFDTEGCYATSGIEASDANKDTLGHKGKDNFSTAREKIESQWMYYAISDIAFANTVLRAQRMVDADKVGITGISWGGLATTIATCYDSRFAFSVPIYLSYYLKDEDNSAKFAIPSFGALVWQDPDVLASNRVPTLLINNHGDKFADINSTMRTYHTLCEGNPYTCVLIKPGLPHSQQAGASVAEIYRFGDWVCSGYAENEKAMFSTNQTITKELGRTYSFELTVPKEIDDPVVTLVYATRGIVYDSEGTLQTSMSRKKQDVTLLRTEANGDKVYRVDVSVYEDVYLYYLSYRGDSAYDADIPITYTYTDYQSTFYGKIFGSTEIIVLGDGNINRD